MNSSPTSRFFWYSWCALIASLVVMGPAGASLATDAVARLDEIVQKHAANGAFSGSVLLAKRGAVVYERSVGHANREWGIPNSSSTRFRIGSVTKQFTAVAILVLAERG